MLRLVVNADDLGLTEAINAGIIKSFSEGILTSASVMANGRGFENACKIVRENPGLDTGIHLTLIEEKPILYCDEVRSLIKDDGNFYKNANDFVLKYLKGDLSFNEIKKELTAQIEKVLDYGINLSHIDSHQHIHMLPKILNITVDLSQKFNIRFIRFPNQKIANYMFLGFNNFKRLAQLTVLDLVCRRGKNKISKKTDHFVGFFNGGKLNKNNLVTLIENLPAEGICELMCHPGINEIKSPYSHWQYHHEDEMLALISEEVKDLINKKGIILTSFNKIDKKVL